jgi:hypothetical protein
MYAGVNASEIGPGRRVFPRCPILDGYEDLLIPAGHTRDVQGPGLRGRG